MFMSSLLSCFAVLFLQLWGVNTLPLSPVCPVSCLCQKTPLLNCSSSGLSRAPSLIPTTATALDLSYNALRSLVPLGSGHAHKRGLQQLWVGNNALERLSLCLRTEGTRTLARRKERCVSWAPDLQLLSAERNQLKCLPRGLGSVKSLRVLQLSWNKISELGPVAIAGCTQLRELHLQHNLINTIHPQAFKDLQRLQVLDLSYNLLTVIPVPAYLSLRNLNTLVAVTGNKWRCDCNLKILRRWISLDNELGSSTWKVVCFSPLHHAGKDLRYLHESEVTCPSHVYNTPGLYKEETMDEGMELLLSCDTVNQDFKQYHWWTPHGHVSESKQILLSNITEQHAGLYVCVSGFLQENVSVLNLNVRKRDHDRRLRREVNMETQNNIQKATAQVPQSEFVVAVCLSVFITFIVAFVLGVVLRPFLDKLCKRIRTKDSTSPPNSRSSSIVPMPYVNEGYSDNDDQVQKVRTGSRVTFGGVTEVKNEAGNVPYYVTVEDARSDSSSDSRTDVDISYDNTHKKESLVKHAGAHCVEVDNLRASEDCNPNSLQELSRQLPLRDKNKKTSLIAETTKIKEFEGIPEPEDRIDLEENSVSSVSSYDMKESVEQSVDPPTVTVLYDGKSITDMEGTTPGCSESPFEQKQECVHDMDPDLWNDSGESFSFSDGSPRSSSRISQLAVLDCPLNKKEMSVDNQSDRQSSCNTSESDESEGGQTEYTINPEEEESENDSIPHSENYNFQPSENGNSSHPEAKLPEQPHTGAGTHFRQDTVTLDPTDTHIAFTRGDSFHDGPFTDHSECSDSSNINDNEEELIEYHVHPVYRTSQTTTSILIDKSNTDSTSEDEDEYSDYPRRLEITELEVSSDHSIPVKIPDKVLNINFDNSSSSTDIEKTSKEGERKNFKGLSVLSVLFNRSRAETDKADQTLSKTTNTDSGRFLGLGFNKQTVSSEDTVKPTIGERSFFGKIGQAFDGLPKLNRSLVFSISDPLLAAQCVSTPDSEFKSQGSPLSLSSQEFFFGNTNVTLGPIPKVKRSLQFTQSEPEISVQDQSNSLNTERITPELVTKPTTKGDSFFGKIGPCPEEVPKVKRYIQFSKSEPEISVQDQSNLLNTERITPELVTKPTTKGDSFFGKIGPCPEEVPKVKRYIQFTQSEPEILVQHSPTSLDTERITSELLTKPQSWKSDSSSTEDLSPATKEDSFFGKTGPDVEVPKVKRYIQFTNSEPEISVQDQSNSLNTERITPELVTNPTTKGDSFFGKIGPCPEEVPKVKRYIQFTKSEPEISVQDPSNSLNTERITSELLTKPQSWRSDSSSEAELSPTTKEGSLFGKIGPFLENVPKVKRCIQFTKSEPELHSLSQSRSESSVQQAVTSDIMKRECKTLGFSSDNIAESSSSFFEGVCMSLDSIPKVKRSLYFSNSEPQSPNQSMFPSLNTKKVTSDTLMKSDSTGSSTSGDKDLSPNQGNFIGQIGLFLDQVPKVERHLQFSQTELNPTSQPSSINIQEVTKTEFQPRSSRSFEDIKQASSGDIFESIGSVDTSVIEIPKLKRYLKFTDSQRVTPELASKPQYTNFERRHSFSSENVLQLTTNTDIFFGKTDTFLKGESKVNRYIHLIQSVPYTPTMSPSPSTNMLATMTEGIDSRKSGENFKPTDTLSLKEDPSLEVVTETSMLGQLSRPKRSLFFSNSDTYVQLDQPFTPVQPGLMQTSLYVSSDDKESSNAQDSNRKAWLSTTVSETTMESRWSNLGLSSTQPHVTESHGLSQIPKRSLQLSTSQEISDSISNSGQVSSPRQHLVADNPIQNVSEETPETPQVSLGKDDAKEYLRHSSEARQRQERRRLMFQQKRRAMDGFSLTSPSSTSDDNEQGSLSVHYERTVPSYSEHTHPGVSTETKSLTASNKDVEISGFEGQRAKSISSLRCKSTQRYGIDKYHSDV